MSLATAWILISAWVVCSNGMERPPNEFWVDDVVLYRPPGGQGCMYNRQYRVINEVFLLGDGCNTCVCDRYNHMVCTLLDCGHNSGCAFGGQVYDIFEHWPLAVGCQACWCQGVDFIECNLDLHSC